MDLQINQQAVKDLGKEVAEEALAPSAEKVRSRQKQHCPRSDHAGRHMADHIEIFTHTVDGVTVVDVGPSREFWWARALEIGGAVNRRPRPFVRPSANP